MRRTRRTDNGGQGETTSRSQKILRDHSSSVNCLIGLASWQQSWTLGETLVMTAARTGGTDIVEQLLVSGADPTAARCRRRRAIEGVDIDPKERHRAVQPSGLSDAREPGR